MRKPYALRRRLEGLLFSWLGPRSIRTRLIVAFGALLALGTLNLFAFHYGASRRALVFDDLRHAIERQTITLETMHQLESQHRQVRLLSEIIGVEGSPPSVAEREGFAARVDSIPERLGRLVDLSAPEDRPSVIELRRKADALATSWKIYFDNRGVDPVRAIEEIVRTAEPLATELIEVDLPAAVAREKERLAGASETFLRMERTSSRSTWLIFVATALLGSLLAIVTSRDLLRAIGALRRGAEKIGRGQLGHRIRIRRRDELAEVASSFNDMAERLRERTEEMEEQRRISESLLLNILPRQVANELRQNGRVEAKYLPDTTIMFADLVGFSRLFDLLSVNRMVRLLDGLFTDFDHIVREYGLEKLKTIGDAYMCAGGLLRESPSHPIDTVMAAFDFIEVVERRAEVEQLPLAIRIGIHTGPVAMGVVGIDKFAFDVWGDTVNFASRLEASSEENRVNISSNTYVRVKDFFSCEHRGEVRIKDGRTHDMYFITGLHPELIGPGRPPAPFRERYRNYFEKPPSGYPRSLVEV